ncbi:endo-beta-1,4-glucanase [Trichodelitschia bisporula]|uniref:cellulase n=1 Tax=Trichodelitschia bisporula TaxID=703511 RepID=A0A6G1I852_9PEZI|nr:endo-beta-1,4-glucanase [Trichodelitschia bisporula]
MGVRSFLVLALASAAFAAPLSLTANEEDSAAAGKFQFFGINESGPEFGEKKFPGIKNKDYVWPELSTIDTFLKKGMNTIRVNFLMERLVPNQLTGKMDEVYLKDLKTTVDYITRKNAYAMIVPHNYGRYYEKIITSPSDFETYWRTTATPFKGDDKVIFDTNNEYHDMDQSLVQQLNQAAINGIRAAGANTQYINAEGNSWSGAWTWVSSGNGASLVSLRDPANKLMYQMHQYLDQDGSGSHAECVSSTIGVERLKAATAWLKQNKKMGVLGEFAGGDNPQCKTAVKGMLEYMKQNSDVWKGAIWWAAGPWWADYMFSLEPGKGKAVGPYLDLISSYA